MTSAFCIKTRFLLLVALVLLLPSPAFANAGTPLMWASMLHLTLGNAVIGAVEGLLLAWFFQAPKARAILTLVLANYVSAWAGAFSLSALAQIPDITIQNIREWFAVFVTGAFLVTLVIELPFFWFVLRDQTRPWRRAIKATLLVNAASYALLCGWYWMASGTSMMTNLEVVSIDKLRPHKEYALYFITPDGRKIIQTDLAGNQPKVVREVEATHRNDRLFARKSENGRYSLFIHLEADAVRDQIRDARDQLITRGFSDAAPVEWMIAEGRSDRSAGTWFNFGKVPKLGSTTDWEYQTGFWPIEGISGENTKDKAEFCFSLETPFAAWIVRNATHLEGDSVVFQLGKDQICLLEPSTRRIAIIARGKGPIVAEPRP